MTTTPVFIGDVGVCVNTAINVRDSKYEPEGYSKYPPERRLSSTTHTKTNTSSLLHTALSILTFVLSLFVSFGPEIRERIVWVLGMNDLTKEYVPNVLNLQSPLGDNPQQPLGVFWPVWVSFITLWTTLTTYGVGGAAHHAKKGWRFVQPGAGGVRFMLVQTMTWVTAALSMAMPWTTLKGYGWLSTLGMVPDGEIDPLSHRGLLVVGSALGMLSNTFCVLGLMTFNPNEKNGSFKSKSRKFDTGKFKWNVFGDSETWWWLFLLLQGVLVIFSWQLAVMVEMSALKNHIVESLLLMVATALLAIPLALTNAVSGKWKHGEKRYRLIMPFQGGPVFLLLQALGWISFSAAVVATLIKLFATAGYHKNSVSISLTASLGFFSYLCIVASLFWFDPSKVKSREDSSDEEDNVIEEDSYKDENDKPRSRRKSNLKRKLPATKTLKSSKAMPSKKVQTLLGRRQSPRIKGALEYLVQWSTSKHPEWVLESRLLELDPQAVRVNEHIIATPRIGAVQRSNGVAAARGGARSASPAFRRVALDATSSDEEDEDSDGEEAPNDVSVVGVDVEWEEIEDEHGNVFFFNVKTGQSQTTVPKRIQSQQLKSVD